MSNERERTVDRARSAAASSASNEATRPPAQVHAASGRPAASASAADAGSPADDFLRLVGRELDVLEKMPDCEAFRRAIADYRREFPEGTATRLIRANDLDHPFERGFMRPGDKAVELEAFRAAHAAAVAAVKARHDALQTRLRGGGECPEIESLLEDFQCIQMLVDDLPR